MKLTDRQCWKVIRDLVSEKNKEYSSFLLKTFSSSEIKEIQGYTRDSFLRRFGFNTLDRFYDYAKCCDNGKEPNSKWLENLSSEDLLLFLDFRCRILQSIYDLAQNNGKIGKSDIKSIVHNTKISQLATYNGVRLKCGSKPARVKDELKNSQLPYTQYQLREKALLQLMGEMGEKLVKYMHISQQQATQIVLGLQTYNKTINGQYSGHKMKSQPQISMGNNVGVEKKIVKEDERKDLNKLKLVGYDEEMNPIFKKNNIFVDFLGDPIPEPEIAYDVYKNPIEEEFGTSAKFVGLDIQGTPIFEYNGKFYTSIGTEVDENELIFNNSNLDSFGL